jgi:REP element-mobilizing transposase RayT
VQTASGLPIRKRVRLRDFHYGSRCVYYVTICAYRRRLLFGRCENDVVTLNDMGVIVREEWLRTFVIRGGTSGDEFTIMPNHLHALIALWGVPTERIEAAHRRELSRVIGGFKSAATSRIRALRDDGTLKIWQPRFSDHVVRNYDEYVRITAYIPDNPRRWCARRYNFTF